jgi:hypothetical protein
VSSYFSVDYQEARRKFINAAHAQGFRIESLQHPTTDPMGRALFTDVAFLGAENPEAILVISSGTHGVEGFAGSAIQSGLITEEIASSLRPHVRLVMIHAINPYGFSHLRRFNEDNIDINRNFRDHSKSYPKNEGYEKLANDIAPASLSSWQDLRSRLHFLWYGLINGKKELQQAISGGQYSHPNGLFYGGRSEAWSNRTIRDIVRRYISGAKRVIIIDAHTGLGPYGSAEVITGVPKGTPEYIRAKSIWGDRVKTTITGDSVSVEIEGPLNLAFSKMLPESEVTAVSLEFGTLPAQEVFWALCSENWLHHYGGSKHPDYRRIKNGLLRVFYPDDNQWKLDVWRQGREVVEQAMKHL